MSTGCPSRREGVGVSDELGRAAAYRDLVAGLLDARQDYASAQFDHALVQAETDGLVDAAAARLLRWWQRESLRSLVEHAVRVVPVTVLALEEADLAVAEEVAHSRRAYQSASAPAAEVTPATVSIELRDTETVGLAVSSSPPTPVPSAAAPTEAPTSPQPVGRVELRPWPGGSVPGPPASSDDEPTGPTPPEENDRPDPTPPAHPDPARRTLVAGLRILAGPDDPARPG